MFAKGALAALLITGAALNLQGANNPKVKLTARRFLVSISTTAVEVHALLTGEPKAEAESDWYCLELDWSIKANNQRFQFAPVGTLKGEQCGATNITRSFSKTFTLDIGQDTEIELIVRDHSGNKIAEGRTEVVT